MGPDFVIAIPRLVVYVAIVVAIWLPCAWVVGGVLGTKSRKPPYKKTIDDISWRGKYPSPWLKRLIAYLFVLFSPLVILAFVAVVVVVFTCAGLVEVFRRTEKAIGLR